MRLFLTSLILLFLTIGGHAQAPQIPVTGNLGAGGVFPLVNSPAVVFTSDANHTMVYPEMSGSSGFLKVTSSTSLTATRNLIAPLTKGFGWMVENATSGSQSIQVIGASGTGITIPNGQLAMVWSDGTNIVTFTSSGGGITALTGDVTASGTGSVGATLATVNANPGTYVLGSTVLAINGKGLITAAGPPFTANLACASNITCGNLEAGVTTASPAGFTASYTNPTVPTSASLSDGTNTVSCTSSFTACSLAHSYCTVGQGLTSFTFTLTAVGGGQTLTPAQSTNCTFRTFAGAGTGGATGATASGTSAVLVGATGTLSNAGLGNQGSYTCVASVQKCYVLMAGGSHTFTSSGFAFPMNSPTSVGFVNVNGVTTPLFAYESTNTVTGTFPLLVASFLLFPLLRKRGLRLASLLLLAAPAMAQIQLGGHVYVPSTSDSTNGAITVNINGNGTCTLTSPSGSVCTITAGAGASAPYVGAVNVTGSSGLTVQLVVPLSPGRTFGIYNGSGSTISAGGSSGASVSIPINTLVYVVCPDGANYYTQAGGGGGSGTVTNVSATGYPAVFGTLNISNPTTTPVFTFTTPTVGQNLFLGGPCTGGSGLPVYRGLCSGDLPAPNAAPTIGTLNGQISAESAVSGCYPPPYFFGASFLSYGIGVTGPQGRVARIQTDCGVFADTTTAYANGTAYNYAFGGFTAADVTDALFAATAVANPTDYTNPLFFIEGAVNNTNTDPSDTPGYLQDLFAAILWQGNSNTNATLAQNAAVTTTATCTADNHYTKAPALSCVGPGTVTFPVSVGPEGVAHTFVRSFLSSAGTGTFTVASSLASGTPLVDTITNSTTINPYISSTRWGGLGTNSCTAVTAPCSVLLSDFTGLTVGAQNLIFTIPSGSTITIIGVKITGNPAGNMQLPGGPKIIVDDIPAARLNVNASTIATFNAALISEIKYFQSEGFFILLDDLFSTINWHTDYDTSNSTTAPIYTGSNNTGHGNTLWMTHALQADEAAMNFMPANLNPAFNNASANSLTTPTITMGDPGTPVTTNFKIFDDNGDSGFLEVFGTGSSGVEFFSSGLSGVGVAGDPWTFSSQVNLFGGGAAFNYFATFTEAQLVPVTAATSGSNQNSDPLVFNGSWWNTGTSAAQADAYCIYNVVDAGNNPTTALTYDVSTGTCAASNSTNTHTVSFPNIRNRGLLSQPCIGTDGSGNEQAGTGCTGSLSGGALGSAPYQSVANTTTFIASPTTTGHTFAYAWQPSGSAIAPIALDLATYLASPSAIGTTTPGAGSFTTLGLAPTGTATSSANFSSNIEQWISSYWNGSAAANDIWQVNTSLGTGTNPTTTLAFTHSGSTGVATVSIPGITPINNAITSATGGSGTGTVACLTANCTNVSGTYSVVGGTFTTGNLLTLVWPTTTTAYKCTATMNGGIGFLGVGNSVATATGMDITNGVSAVGVTVTVNYSCSQY